MPLILTLHGRVVAEVRDLRADVADVRCDLHALAERVARIEGQLSWRPANGTPVPPAAPSTEPTAT